jgi:hypothetical protein
MNAARLARRLGWTMLALATTAAVYLGARWAVGRRVAVVVTLAVLGAILVVAADLIEAADGPPGPEDLEGNQPIIDEFDTPADESAGPDELDRGR